MALIDTGATSTCIDVSVPPLLGLAELDKIEVLTPAGKDTQSRYAVRLDFPGWGVDSLPMWLAIGSKLAATGTTIGGHPLLVLLGRDWLQNKVLHYDGQIGTWTICE